MKSLRFKPIAGAILIGLALFASGSASAQINLVSNGGFEKLSAPLGLLDGIELYDTALPNGWNTSAKVLSNLIVGPSGNPFTNNWSGVSVAAGFQIPSPDGGNFVLSNGASCAAVYNSSPISQQISGLTVGQGYTLTFFQAASASQNQVNTAWWDVSFGGQTQSSAVMSNLPGSSTPWQTVTMSFVAGSSSQLLSFLANGTGPVGVSAINATLDGVSLVATPVPEAGTWALMLAGLTCCAFVSRRRQGAKA